jgi:ketosteroid isomerase-like protein
LSSAILRQVEGTGAVEKGPEAVRHYWDEWHAIWKDTQVEVLETRDLGDTVLALVRLHAEGTTSGVELDRTFGWLFGLQDALIRRAWAYLNPEEALEAAGLRSRGTRGRR